MADSLSGVQVNQADLQRMRAILNPDQLKRGLFQAVKRTADAGAKTVVDHVVEQSGMTKKYATRAVQVKVDGGNANNPVGEILISKKPVPLIAFKPSVTKRGGVFAKLGAGGELIFKHGFRAIVQAVSTGGDTSEHTGIFVRVRGSRGQTRKGRPRANAQGIGWRLPIKQLFGPSVYSTVKIPEVQKLVEQDLTDRLTKEINSQIARFTAGK